MPTVCISTSGFQLSLLRKNSRTFQDAVYCTCTTEPNIRAIIHGQHACLVIDSSLESLVGAARQPLCSVILSQSIFSVYLSMFSADFRHWKQLQCPGNPLQPGVALHTARFSIYIMYFPVHFVAVTNTSPHDNLSPTVVMCCQHHCMRFSSASQKGLPTCPH